jgi:hypothetical protein
MCSLLSENNPVNPHLVPLFYAQSGGTGRPAPRFLMRMPGDGGSGLRGGFILSMLERLLKLDMGKWFRLLADLDLLPTVFGADWRFIYLQKLKGTVTIVPDAPWWVYFSIISDPTLARMRHYQLTGERATWPKLARISNHFRVEKTLIECSRLLEREAQRAGLAPNQREKVSHRNSGDVVASLLSASPQPSPTPSSFIGDVAADVAASATSSWEFANAVPSAAAAAASSSADHNAKDAVGRGRRNGNGHRGATTARSNSRSKKEKEFLGVGHGGDRALHPSVSPSPSASPSSASVSASAASSGVFGDEELVDDPLVTRDPLSSGEIAHSLTATLLGADPAPPRPVGQHGVPPPSSSTSPAPLDDTMSPAQPPPHSLWKRGIDTDTDNTDEEEEEVEVAAGVNPELAGER